MSESSTQQAYNDLLQSIESGGLRYAQTLLNSLKAGEIAHLIESLPPKEGQIIWDLLDHEREGEVLVEVGDEVQHRLMSNMKPEDLAAVTDNLDTDDLADFLQSLPNKLTDQIIQSLDAQQRKRLDKVLAYPEDSAGGLMNIDTITIRSQVTLDVVLRYLRRRGELPSQTDSLIVVDGNDNYLGILPLTTLLTSLPDVSVYEVMDSKIEAISANTTDTAVAKIFETQDLISAPVVDENNKLLGRITIDDVVDVIREDAEHSMMGMAGLTEETDLFAKALPSAKRRAIWLGINLLTAFMASWVVDQFEATIAQVVTVAVLMNIVASMGGIAGTQTLTLVIRGMALEQVTAKNINYLFTKEIFVGLINGLLWALVVALIAGFWFQNIKIGYIIAAAITINLFFAAFSGVAIPLILRRMKIDPAIAGSVILTTVTDIVGLLSFLGLASLFLV
ncbi:MAG: magnesium transporter [Gammaproteobacteria bacterium]|nr:magnesium transporter [Gammaproteobacteria bacterium]